MTHEQREKLCEIMGRIYGLTCGVEDQQISERFCGVVEDLERLLKEDGEKHGGDGWSRISSECPAGTGNGSSQVYYGRGVGSCKNAANVPIVGGGG